MNIDLLYHPYKREEVTVEWDGEMYDDLTYFEWVELMEKVENGDVSYVTWYQDDEETNGELMCLNHDYVIKNGKVKSYDQALTE